MTESEILRLIRCAGGISQLADEQAAQPDTVTAENYARVVAEVMLRDGIELNGVAWICATYEQESLSCWHTVAVLNNGGRARKILTSGRSRNGCGGNLLIFPITQNCVGWWVSCRSATRP